MGHELSLLIALKQVKPIIACGLKDLIAVTLSLVWGY